MILAAGALVALDAGKKFLADRQEGKDSRAAAAAVSAAAANASAVAADAAIMDAAVEAAAEANVAIEAKAVSDAAEAEEAVSAASAAEEAVSAAPAGFGKPKPASKPADRKGVFGSRANRRWSRSSADPPMEQ